MSEQGQPPEGVLGAFGPRTEPDIVAEPDQSAPPDQLASDEASAAGTPDGAGTPGIGGTAIHAEAPPLRPPPPSWRQRRLVLARNPLLNRNAEITSKILTALALVGMTVFVVWQLRPDLIFGPNMDVGGDNGGHVAAPYYLIHHLLNHGQITGWDPWWFDGFPLYVFYFPLPALFVAAFNLVFPYAVAFKIVTVLGTVTLPICAWAFGCLAGFRRPVPVLMAGAMLPYLFETTYTIDGGNITSTMAGEFSFSLAISFGMLFLGVFAYALRTGRLRWLAAALFAVTMLCHVVPALAFAAVAVLFALGTGRLSALKVLLPVGIVGALLAAFWLLPFAVDLGYSSSMNYLRVPGLAANLAPHGAMWFIVPAALGTIIGVVQLAAGSHEPFAAALAIAAAGSGLAFGYLPSGIVYNGRWLPFWFLFLALMAAYGIAEVFRGIGYLLVTPWGSYVGTFVGTIACLAGAASAGGLVGAFPFISPVGNQTQVQGWINWNYTGFQGKPGWPQYQGMINMLDSAGKKYGCGRLQYEYISETTDPFGSTEAMMALPMQTNGCMETTDGIYFESSTTTPYHFLDVSEVSQDNEAPDPVSGLDYPGYNLPDGIRHLQLMGVRYFLAMSPPVEASAAVDPSLVKIAETPGFAGNINSLPDPHPVWQLFLIKNSPLVAPLAYYPVVEPQKSSSWQNENVRWYEDNPWPVPVARSGPPSWPHAPAGRLEQLSQGVPTPGTIVSDVKVGDSSISFNVTKLGSPVLVKIPYFPNWRATGASGPYETSPNLMSVVPFSHHVTLSYGSTMADWVGKGASAAGLAGVVALGLLKPVNVGGAGTPANDPTDQVTPSAGALADEGRAAGGSSAPTGEGGALPVASWSGEDETEDGDTDRDERPEDDQPPEPDVS